MKDTKTLLSAIRSLNGHINKNIGLESLYTHVGFTFENKDKSENVKGDIFVESRDKKYSIGLYSKRKEEEDYDVCLLKQSFDEMTSVSDDIRRILYVKNAMPTSDYKFIDGKLDIDPNRDEVLTEYFKRRFPDVVKSVTRITLKMSSIIVVLDLKLKEYERGSYALYFSTCDKDNYSHSLFFNMETNKLSKIEKERLVSEFNRLTYRVNDIRNEVKRIIDYGKDEHTSDGQDDRDSCEEDGQESVDVLLQFE